MNPDKNELERRIQQYLRPRAMQPPRVENPTETGLVWGTRAGATTREFRGRAAIVTHLKHRHAPNAEIAVDPSGGAGRWIDVLAQSVPLLVHMDLSRNALERAQRDHPHVRNVVFMQNDLYSSPLLGDIPLVYSLDTLCYPGDFCAATLDHIRTMLSSNGVAILEFPNALRAWTARLIKGKGWRGPKKTWRIREAKDLCESAGLNVKAHGLFFRELGPQANLKLNERGGTALAPFSTWFYLVVRITADPGQETRAARNKID
jgi:methyltransferase family protein